MNTARMTTIQPSVKSSGYGQGRPEATEELGHPHSARREEVSVLIGVHSAIGCRMGGSVAGGTNTLETKVIGKITVNTTCWPTSTLGTDNPSQMPSHDMQ